MSAWTVPLRPGLAISFDGEQFTVAEIEGRRILLRQAAVAGAPKWRQVDISVLLSHPTTQVLVDAPEEEPTAAAVLGGLVDSEDDALTVRFRHVQEVRTGYQLGTAELALEGEPRLDYAPGVPLMHRYAAKAAEIGVDPATVRRWVARVKRAGPAGLVTERPATSVLDRADHRWLDMARSVLKGHEKSSRPVRNLILLEIEERLVKEYGKGTVPMPARTTGYELLRAFYRKQNQRFSTFNTPRLVCCFNASDPDWLKLPRGLADEATQLITTAGGTLTIAGGLPEPPPITAHFTGKLTPTQQAAVDAMSEHPAGTLVAPPGSGKTVMACALIAHHRTPTAVIVNRAELLAQWKERLAAFLDLDDRQVGSLGGGKDHRGHIVDLIMLQTLSHRDALDDLLDGYGLVIVDECHAVGAPGAEAAIRRAKALRWVGLSATPYRADQMDPVITMQCGRSATRSKTPAPSPSTSSCTPRASRPMSPAPTAPPSKPSTTNSPTPQAATI
jgi:hypothetical protein